MLCYVMLCYVVLCYVCGWIYLYIILASGNAVDCYTKIRGWRPSPQRQALSPLAWGRGAGSAQTGGAAGLGFRAVRSQMHLSLILIHGDLDILGFRASSVM